MQRVDHLGSIFATASKKEFAPSVHQPVTANLIRILNWEGIYLKLLWFEMNTCKVVLTVFHYQYSRIPAMTMPLLAGSPFDKKLIGKQQDNTPIAPSRGFFELVNKSDAAIGIKVLFVPAATAPASSVLWEVCRPVYISLPPQESVHGFFPEDVVDLTLVFLHSNPNPLVPNISFQQANPVVTSEAVLPPKCYQIGEFADYTAFTVKEVGQRNVLLKFKGGAGRYCDIEPRVGTSIQV